MGEINLTSDERKKALHEEWQNNNQEYENLLKVNNKVSLSILYSTNLQEKVSNFDPISNHDWKSVTIIDPSKDDNCVFINFSGINKRKVVTNEFFQAYQNHTSSAYLKDLENKQLANTEVPDENESASSNILNEIEYFKDYPEVSLSNKKEKLSLKGTLLEQTTEFPVMSEPDLGFFPQLPLLSMDRFKNTHFEKSFKLRTLLKN